MVNLTLVGLGGFFGSMARYALDGLVYRLLREPLFPYGTLFINVLGCFLIGLLSGLAEQRGLFTGETRAFLLIGVLGGFTTFSTFGYETFALLRDGQALPAVLNIFFQVGLGVGGVWLGYALARNL